MRISRDLALIDDAILMIVKELYRVLDREDVVVPVDIDLVDHRRQGRGFTRAGRSGHEDEATRLFAHIGHDGRQSQGLECLDLVRDRTKYGTNRSLLVEEIGTKT